MQLVEYEIESSLASVFATIPGAKVITSWGAAEQGEVKGELMPADTVTLSIAVGAPQYDQYTVPACSLPVALVVGIRREAAPTGAKLAEVLEPVASVLNTLQRDYSAVNALSTPGFTADGVRLDGGTAPEFDKTLNIWRVTRAFTIRGVIADPEP